MEKKTIDILSEFKLAIFKSGKKKIEIAKAMKVTDGHLVNILNGRDKLSAEKRARLNKILKTSI